MTVLPPVFLFRYALPVRRIGALPKRGRRLLDLPSECGLAFPAELNGGGSVPPSSRFAEVRAAWNEKGLGLSVEVRGKRHPPAGEAAQPTEADGLQVWIDTRNTQSVHRATRFCHHFCLLPASGGVRTVSESGRAGNDKSLAAQVPIARAREEAPIAGLKVVRTAAEVRQDGYLLEAWLPSEALYGFDPEASPRLGFYYLVRDAELGEQFLTIDRDFPFEHDPSLWSTLELKD